MWKHYIRAYKYFEKIKCTESNTEGSIKQSHKFEIRESNQ